MCAPSRRYALLLAAVMACAGSVARADPEVPQDAPRPAAPQEPVTTPNEGAAPGAAPGQPASPELTAPPGDPAWQLYDRAFLHLARGEAAMAQGLLATLRARYPAHPAAHLAATRAAELSQPRGPGVVDSAAPAPLGDESASQLARAELALTMTLAGVASGLEACKLFECTGERAQVASVMVGSGASLGLSLYFTRRGITAGQSQAMSSGLLWGSWNALMLSDSLFEGGEGAAIHLLGRGAGLGVGIVAGQQLEPTSGQVALANTTALWSSVLALMFHGVIEEEPTITSIALAGDAGLLLGSLLARGSHITRGRSLLIDTGGVLGMLVGGLLVATMQPDEGAALFVPLILTTSAGLGIATYATRHWDGPSLPGGAQVVITPMGEGGWGAVLSL